MDLKYNSTDGIYSIFEKIGTQTFQMDFCQDGSSNGTLYFYIVMSLYSKRKDKNFNEDSHKATGKNPTATLPIALKCFDKLEETIIKDFGDRFNILIYCTWSDNRRRDIYHHYLKKRGYDYGRVDGMKVIIKKINKGQ